MAERQWKQQRKKKECGVLYRVFLERYSKGMENIWANFWKTFTRFSILRVNNCRIFYSEKYFFLRFRVNLQSLNHNMRKNGGIAIKFSFVRVKGEPHLFFSRLSVSKRLERLRADWTEGTSIKTPPLKFGRDRNIWKSLTSKQRASCNFCFEEQRMVKINKQVSFAILQLKFFDFLVLRSTSPLSSIERCLPTGAATRRSQTRFCYKHDCKYGKLRVE